MNPLSDIVSPSLSRSPSLPAERGLGGEVNTRPTIKRGILTRSPLLTLLLILVLALALRLIALGSRTLWYDEAFAVLFSEKGLNAMLYGTLTPVNGAAADVHPLLYYVTLDGWMHLVGQTPAAVRLYSVLVSLAAIAALYALTNELFGERTALAAALITAIAPFYVQYSQEARMYALLGLLLVAATWAFVRGWRTGQTRYWIAFGVLAGASMYAQQLAAFYLAALGLVPFIARKRKPIIGVVFGAILALLIYGPWLIDLPSQLGKVGNYWILRPTAITPLITLWSYFFADIETHSTFVILISLIALVLFLTFLITRAIPTLRRPGRERNRIGLVLWLFVIPIALTWIVSQRIPVYLTRGLLPSGLMLYIALAWLLTRTRLPRPIVGLLCLAGLATVAAGLSANYSWNTFPRPPFDTADQQIAAQWQSGDQVVHANKITMLSMVYYDRLQGHTLAQSYIRDAPGSGEDTLALPTQQVLKLLADDCVSAAAKGSSRVWYVIFDRQITESGGTSPDLTWLDNHYQRVSDQHFNDLSVYLYDHPDSVAQQAKCEG